MELNEIPRIGLFKSPAPLEGPGGIRWPRLQKTCLGTKPPYNDPLTKKVKQSFHHSASVRANKFVLASFLARIEVFFYFI